MDLRARLPAITAPTLVLAGADDPATPPGHGALIAERIDGARLHVIPGAAHLAAVSAADASPQRSSAHLRAAAAADDAGALALACESMTTSARRANTPRPGQPARRSDSHRRPRVARASAGQANSDFVQSLDRGLAVIRAFGPDRERLSLSEVARETGLTRAATRRFLLTLVKLGYVRNDGREFSLRPRVLELGYAYLSGLAHAGDRLAAPGGAGRPGPGVVVDLGAGRRSHRVRGQGADQADHDGGDLGRHQVPGVRHLDGPGAAGRDDARTTWTGTWPRPTSSRSPGARSPIRTGSGRSSARSASRATRSWTRNSKKACARSQRPFTARRRGHRGDQRVRACQPGQHGGHARRAAARAAGDRPPDRGGPQVAGRSADLQAGENHPARLPMVKPFSVLSARGRPCHLPAAQTR